MNDKTIINTISTIYFAIVSLLSFIFLLLATIFIVLQNGLYIDNISIPNIQVKQLYIKWNEKVDISVKEISIVKKESKSNTKLDYKKLDEYLKNLSLASNWFESIVIEKISFNEVAASFKYKDGKNGFIVASSPDLYINASLYLESEHLNMKIIEFKDFKRNINLNGTLFFNPKDIKLSAILNIDINSDIDATLFVNTDINKLRYKIKSNKKIKSIIHVINMFNLPKEARYWALDAIDMSYLNIESATGFIDFNNLSEAYKNVKVKATINKMNYTYDKQLDSIHTQTTLLEFRDGILFIYPKKAYSYGMYLDKSWLKIDFTKKEEVLTLHLLFDGKINKSMLKILNRYKIKLPFLQREGEVATNLTLVVNLRTIDIDAQGDFFTKKANFDYLGLNIDIYDAYIKLNNHDVQIDNMRAKYKDIATSEVDVRFNAKTSKGTIFFRTEHISLNDNTIVLHKNPINIKYNISPTGDTINIDKSKWKYADFIVDLNNLTVPFNLDTLLVNVPATYFDVNDVASGFIAGNIAVDTMEFALRSDILKFNYSGIEFSKSNTPLNISYDGNLTISPVANILFNIDGSDFDLNDAIIKVDENSISLKHANILSINGLFSGEIDALYNKNSNSGTLSINNLNIENRANNNLFYSKDKVTFSFKSLKESIQINSKELDLKFTTQGSDWSAEINSLYKISNDSKFLKALKLTKGKVNFYKKNSEKSIRFNANIIYPYKLLVENDKPTDRYKIKGKISSKKSFLNINEKVTIKVNHDIAVNIKESAINIPELSNALSDINISSSQENSRSIIINASNSYLYVGHDRKIISERMKLQYHNGITTAQLEHKNGHAGFKLDGKKIHLYGENFNDEFMQNLFSLAKFRGGKLSFSMNGTIDNYDGLFYITDSTIVDYKMLNNILAFINTVPSLVTFSLPGYSKSGLNLNSAYINFNAKNSVFEVSDFFFDSKEIDILGGGMADLNKDKVDVTLNLKTDLGSSLSKIPLVGHVLLGKDNTISTTMKITGKLTDPDVKSLLAKDIAVAPINIVKRALLLPYDLIKSIGDSNKSK